MNLKKFTTNETVTSIRTLPFIPSFCTVFLEKKLTFMYIPSILDHTAFSSKQSSVRIKNSKQIPSTRCKLARFCPDDQRPRNPKSNCMLRV